VTDEGYTHVNDYGKTIELFQQLRESYLGALGGDQRDEFERHTDWITKLAP
jgi:hypothetical protein